MGQEANDKARDLPPGKADQPGLSFDNIELSPDTIKTLKDIFRHEATNNDNGIDRDGSFPPKVELHSDGDQSDHVRQAKESSEAKQRRPSDEPDYHDQMGWKKEEHKNKDGSVSYFYRDKEGHLQAIKFPEPPGGYEDIVYDAAGNVSRVNRVNSDGSKVTIDAIEPTEDGTPRYEVTRTNADGSTEPPTETVGVLTVSDSTGVAQFSQPTNTYKWQTTTYEPDGSTHEDLSEPPVIT